MVGSIGPEGFTAHRALLGATASGQLLIAVERNTGGERMTATLSALAEAAGVARTRVLPFDGQKDWNAVLQGRRRSTA